MKQCPICHNNANSVQNTKSVSEIKKAAATYGGKFAAKQVGGAIGSFVGGFLGLGDVGYSLGSYAGGMIAGEAISDHYSTPQWDGTYIHKCPHCGLEWHSSRKEADIANSIQQNKHEEEKSSLFSDILRCLAILIIPTGLTWLCWYYCHTHESKSFSHHYDGFFGFGAGDVYSTNWSWYFVGLLMIIFGIIALVGISTVFLSDDGSIWDALEQHKRALRVRKMSLEEYVRDKLSYFNSTFKKPIQ